MSLLKKSKQKYIRKLRELIKEIDKGKFENKAFSMYFIDYFNKI